MSILVKAGRYEIIGELGRGAMGVVYKAKDPVIGRIVAVKTVRLSEEGSGLSRSELLQRFQTEARAAGLLTHPNIVVIYDAGEEEGLFYITMELVEGKSLLGLIEAQQQFPLPRVLRIMEQTCSALQFAHERNVVHRDIKPANLMMTADDTVKVTDFGTAKIMQFGAAQQTSHVMGTPSYMSPEQVKGKAVDGRSDIFSLGVVLYEMLTREKPFPGQNITSVIYKIVNEEPVSPCKIDPSIHPGLNTVILKALAKEPAMRYQNCRELLEDLRNYRSLAGGPDATVVMNAASVPAVAARSASEERLAGSLGAPARALPPGGNPALTPSPRRTGYIAPYEEPPEKPSPLLRAMIVILLLGVIAYGGYRLRPFMQDMMSRHERQAAGVAAPSPENPAAAQASVASSSVAGGTNSAALPVSAGAPLAAEGNASLVTPPPADPPASAAGKKTAATLSSVASEFKSQMEGSLSQMSFSDRVTINGSGNTLSVSGRLRPNEHHELLKILQRAPAAVNIVDNIEYDDAPDASGGGGSEASEHPVPEAGHGALHLVTDVIGAKAVLKGPTGAEIANCQTPCVFKELTPATYQLDIRKSGYHPSISAVKLNPGEVLDQKIIMQSAIRGIYVTSRPAGAQLFIGNKPAGKTPITLDLAPNSYDFALKLDGFETYTGNAQVKSNVQTILEAELTPQSKGRAWVEVQSDPAGAEILVDDVATGMTTPSRVATSPGMHRVTIVKKEGAPVMRRILVQEGQTVQVNDGSASR
ncbi:MAG: protein kinase [Acidobacteriia bacterium]|nr:protein kinase [Terriglobia bacterium]